MPLLVRLFVRDLIIATLFWLVRPITMCIVYRWCKTGLRELFWILGVEPQPQGSEAEALPRQLHWLPIAEWINYKVALLTFKTRVFHKPQYLDSLLVPYAASRSLRSDTAYLLAVPHTKTVLHSRAFASYAPRLWNRLPQNLRDLAHLSSTSTNPEYLPNLASFKSGLKTFLFDSSSSFLVPWTLLFHPAPLNSDCVIN